MRNRSLPSFGFIPDTPHSRTPPSYMPTLDVHLHPTPFSFRNSFFTLKMAPGRSTILTTASSIAEHG